MSLFVGQLKQWLKPFNPCHNKVALVQDEKFQKYEVMQYLVENEWNLVVQKSLTTQQKWELMRKMDDDTLQNLHGTTKIYDDKFAKNPCFEKL